MTPPLWQTEFGDGPLVACAIHDGHAMRPEVAALLRLDSAARRYEEDPYTGAWTIDRPDADHRPTLAVRGGFQSAARKGRLSDAGGRLGARRMEVAPAGGRGGSLARRVRRFLRPSAIAAGAAGRSPRAGRRLRSAQLQSCASGVPAAQSANPQENPEINLGTGTMDRDYWSRIVERWLAEMRQYDYLGRRLDVRENVKFFGGQLPAWIHQNFPEPCARWPSK